MVDYTLVQRKGDAMKLTIEGFGPSKKPVVIEPKALTIFCGVNNTGKTYALYVLNALMDSRLVAGFDIAKSHGKRAVTAAS